MATWKLFGKDVTTEQLPAELRAVLAQMQRERTAFEEVTNGARAAVQDLTQLAQPVADAQRTIAELQGRLKALERVTPVLATLDEQTEDVARTQRRMDTQLVQMTQDTKGLRTEIEQLRSTLDDALALKHDLVGFLELGGGFKALRIDADRLTDTLRDVTQGFDRTRDRQEELRRASDGVAARLSALEERQQQVQNGVGTAETRATALGQTLQDLGQAAADAAQTRRQLLTLKALAETLVQKTSVLEQQRDFVERATGQVTRLPRCCARSMQRPSSMRRPRRVLGRSKRRWTASEHSMRTCSRARKRSALPTTPRSVLTKSCGVGWTRCGRTSNGPRGASHLSTRASTLSVSGSSISEAG